MNVIELKAVMLLPDGRELVHTGYYVHDTVTIADVKEMFAKGLQTEFGLKEHTNTGKALQFYETAVKQKSLEAMLRLGDMYSAPRGTTRGIEQNIRRAIAYYRRAEKLNNEYAKRL